MLSVALTGNIAAGKTTVARLFHEWGATVIDADRLAQDAQAPGGPVLARIVERFGPGTLRPDASLDRAALRRAVLADPEALRALNAIVHPEVHRRRRAALAEARARGDRIVVTDIPLLFEADDPTGYDAIVLVDAPAAVRRDRIVRERGLGPDEADRMLAAQAPAEGKRSHSDFVIENAGSRAELERVARTVWLRLEARAAESD
ncbi:MAG TPA: dephospho-CoA kinase [Gemmatimonadales bacterium]|nr:dephospho-CoA kinase [Gemmatimonadales bacterium]